MNTIKRGFTLIELLVVVLIIGILTAIALPQFETAVDKSRYSTLMPVTKTVADAQEVFYLANANYSVNFENLDVLLPNHPSGNYADLGNGTKIEMGHNTQYDYVKASKDNLENNYIIYQQRSANYPAEIHCEALSNNERAQRLCRNLGGVKIDGSITSGYDTYVLHGNGNGTGNSNESGNTSPQNTNGGGTVYRGTEANGKTLGAGDVCDPQYGGGGCWNVTLTANAACNAHSGGECYELILQNQSTCTSDTTFGGCGRSSFSNESACFSYASGSCNGSTFTDNAVCYANAENSCKGGTWEGNSCCSGEFCPSDAPLCS